MKEKGLSNIKVKKFKMVDIGFSMNSFFCSIGKDLASNIAGGYDSLIFVTIS